MGSVALIIGAGPAGLTTALELLRRTDIKPIVFEREGIVGGISRTVNYKGNRIDIGGHRFFSKSDRVMQWWTEIMPLEESAPELVIGYQNQTRSVPNELRGARENDPDRVMLVRERCSRILYGRKFYAYPIALSAQTIQQLGLGRTARIGISYAKSVLRPIRPEANLEEFMINRFGRELYETFFRDYTEKVWGVPCGDISAEWGAQRIKGLSITKAVTHFVRSQFRRAKDVAQKDQETSLIERFMYPKYGPGQMWETVAAEVRRRGGEIHMNIDVQGIRLEQGSVTGIRVRDQSSDQSRDIAGNFLFSTTSIPELIDALDTPPPTVVQQISRGLLHRDFITVGLLVKELICKDATTPDGLIKDNWIYIQEPDVKVGRMQIFNNWSPSLVADPRNVWIGLEYFCNRTDPMWSAPDSDLIELAIQESCKIGMIDRAHVLDGTVLRVPRTYPAYFGTYDRFDEIRAYVDQIPNLFLIGRNGMHRYNNQDHSMLTAMVSVDNIVKGQIDKANIWDVNTEQDYHEEKK